jgi:hypothetical protein
MTALRLLFPWLIAATFACATGAPADRHTFPAEFASGEAAAEWARASFAGGKVDTIGTNAGRHLVVFQHGSGRPVVRIGLYRKEGRKWRLMAGFAPPTDAHEFLTASVRRGNIVLIGERSGRVWPLPEPG